MRQIEEPFKCTVCGSKLDTSIEYFIDNYSILCPRCGDFLLTDTLFGILQERKNNKDQYWRWILSHYIRSKYNGKDKVRLANENIHTIEKQDLPDEKQQSYTLLKYLGDNIKHPSEKISVDTRLLTALIGTINISGVDYISDHLMSGRLITFQIPGQGSWYRIYGLTMEGWRKYRSIIKKITDKPTIKRVNRIRSSVKRLNVFLCHASEDKEIVRNLYSKLMEDNFKPWLDDQDILPGQEWKNEIEKAVRSCNIILVCLSNKSVSKSGYVQKEIKIALDVADEQPENTIYLIPLKLEQCTIPDRLMKWQWVDYYKDDGYQKLLKALDYRENTL